MRIVAAPHTVQARVEQAFYLNCQDLCAFLANPNVRVAASVSGGGSSTPPPLLKGLPSRAHEAHEGRLRAQRSILHQCAAQRRLSVLQMFDVLAATAGRLRTI